jgi:hypothetical protein
VTRTGVLTRLLLLTTMLITALGAGACAGGATTGRTTTASARPTLSRNGVTVTLSYVATPAAGPGTGRLVATFRPQQPGFHLYSKDLPPGGISGVGYPTRARPVNGLASTGTAEASVDPVPLEVQTIGLTLPVYPDGPVTLTEPVHRLSQAAGTSSILVSYAACSHTLCLPPVVDQPVAVALAQA